MDEPNPPVVVICGGSAGVGRATAHRFAAAGYRVGLLARGAQALADTEDELQQRGTRTLGIGVDVADAAAVLEAARRIEHELGPVQVWINCAMTTVFSPVRQLSAEEIQRVTSVTYLGTVHGTMAALALMEPRDRGVIIQVGSALAYRAIPLQAAYCGAKFAVRGFTDSLRCELLHARSGIRVCMVQLPAINTPQFDWARNKLDKRPQPVPPIHDPDVAARAILSVVRRTPRELWLGAASVKAIVGTCLMPGLLDRLLARRACTGQMTREDDDGQRPDNLFESQQSLHRIQGRFSGQSRADALALSSTQVSALLLVVCGLLAVTLLLF
ncbi:MULTISPECIES: SDR family oxidoreductase [unclassified Pseudomonas]|uniref:SDR family oxidoreductase n=1 Tax=unclassified Pseudomonas TaxID=196821 RepID=UPI0009086CA0|nr:MULTISPECIES: SDR family oxidoreductase [unclassified Pseudomonas]ROO34007.1 short-chain dehydrogenase [Pseudomonas sp. 7SR1]SFW46651.1 NADP-dependent 3-hydroxy acid dehydrogenase YdfG [Pseudomonas sp. NFACC09-4]SFX52916.1 NADP-dependent 3-hydroxy acid dehydrogenase YdfG [Pseudomonas sp. NFACC47-1]SFX79641.1 NADP-dependent 3-hydroxy acid dehydrogenase YdfG [Pseudomonas sp. NFACC43]SIS26164.1 NADP-dependent 3-hydroxy acid dehydrogenase YdfG [Pseudomonas sp. 7SR1]